MITFPPFKRSKERGVGTSMICSPLLSLKSFIFAFLYSHFSCRKGTVSTIRIHFSARVILIMKFSQVNTGQKDGADQSTATEIVGENLSLSLLYFSSRPYALELCHQQPDRISLTQKWHETTYTATPCRHVAHKERYTLCNTVLPVFYIAADGWDPST